MVTLKFTLAPEAAGRVHGIVACLGKFSEIVSIEARKDRFSLMALNPSKTAYASFSLDTSRFFSYYEFVPGNASVNGRFTCCMLNKALSTVFKSRLVDSKEKESSVERCEVHVQDRPDETACRFVVTMICHNGVTKKYQLTYEATEVMHALFDRSVAVNRWQIRSSILREYTEFFGPKTEQLDIYAEGGKVTFMSFTEKIVDNKQEILKYPLQTSVSVSIADFEEFKVQEKLHVIISVKDFKAVAAHAATLDTAVIAYYSQPSRPMQLSYSTVGMHCEFTLMTTGDARLLPPTTSTQNAASRADSHAVLTSHGRSTNARAAAEKAMAPVNRNTNRQLRPVGPGTQAGRTKAGNEDPESLFLTQDDDQRWEPINYQDEEDNLTWDASANYVGREEEPSIDFADLLRTLLIIQLSETQTNIAATPVIETTKKALPRLKESLRFTVHCGSRPQNRCEKTHQETACRT